MSNNKELLAKGHLEGLASKGLLLQELEGLCIKKSTWIPTAEFCKENPKYKDFEGVLVDSFTFNDPSGKIDYKTFSLAGELDINFGQKGKIVIFFSDDQTPIPKKTSKKDDISVEKMPF